MFCMLKKKRYNPAYVSKNNSNQEKQVSFLTIRKGKGWDYLAVKTLLTLFKKNLLNITMTLLFELSSLL